MGLQFLGRHSAVSLALTASALMTSLAGCLSLPAPAPTDTRTHAGDSAPSFELVRTGASAGEATLAELTGPKGAVLVFYRGDW